MYFFHKFLSQFLGFNGFFRAFRGIFPSKMPHCTYFICPIYKIRIGVSSGITPAPIHIYYNCISKICQSACFAPRRNTSRKMARAHRTESGILHVPSAVFQELHNFIFLSLCTLRIDKSIRNMYNKARNQRSTAEAQERANPAGLKQKGARPMVDMEPAQQGQAVGIR